MRQFLLFSLLFFGVLTGSTAQTRPDLVYKLDQTSFSAYVDEIGENEITYFLPSDTQKKRPQRVSKAQVWKVVFANGDTELFNEPRQAVISPAPPQKAAVPDRIYLKSKSIVEGSITKISEKSVEYRRLGTPPNSPVYELSREKIQKIEYGNGDVESFENELDKSKTIVRKEKPDKTPKAKSATSKNPKQTTGSPPKELNKHSNIPKESKISINGAFVGSYIVKDNFWVADSSGIGLRQGIGGALQVNFRLSKRIWLSFQGGYNQFQTNRLYTTPDKDILYTAKTKLSIIPIHLGLKAYLAKGVYLGLWGGVNYLTTDFGSYGDYNLQTKRFSPTGTATLGFEPRIGPIKLDIGLQYSYATVNATSVYESSPAIQIPQIKLGIGF
ncbi:hypothetical protein [Runella sp.]|uniref:hypothetical protein n=1 Tax=Runella sp. TaxID=1960881 RepID=UPI0030166B0A